MSGGYSLGTSDRPQPGRSMASTRWVAGRRSNCFAPDFHGAADAVDQHQVPVAIALQPIAQPQGIAVGIPIGW